MPLAEILATIRREGETEIAALQAKTDRRVEELLARASVAAAAAEAEESAAGDTVVARRAEEIVNRARLDVERRIREGREALHQQALAAVRGRLAAIRDTPAYGVILRRLVEECRTALPTATSVAVDPADASRVEELLAAAGQGGIRVAPSLQTWGGVELADDDARRVRNTFEARLEKAQPELRLLAGELVPALRGAAP